MNLPRAKKAIEASLLRKGFIPTEGDHHYFIYVTRDGRKSRARTKTSHSPKVRDVADNLLGQMARQCFLFQERILAIGRLPDGPR